MRQRILLAHVHIDDLTGKLFKKKPNTMADKKEYMLQLHTPGDNDNMNSAHIHCKLFWRAGHSSRSEQPKGNENAIKKVV
jgi:hypothetical protein